MRGDNTNNRLLLDKQDTAVEKAEHFKPVLEDLGPVADVAVAESHTVGTFI